MHESSHTHLILGQKIKGSQITKNHKVQKHISVECDRVAGVSLHSVEWTASSFVILSTEVVNDAYASRLTVMPSFHFIAVVIVFSPSASRRF